MPNTWSIKALIDHLKTEQKSPSRFPARVIFINSLSNYREFVEEIISISDNVIHLSRFCKTVDLLPDINELSREIKETDYKSNLVLSMGEYLRLSIKIERDFAPKFKALFNLQQQPISSKRLWMPLYCATHLFEELVGYLDIRHENDVYYVEPLNTEEKFFLRVYSTAFNINTNALDCPNTLNGLQSWIKLWDDKVLGNQYELITAYHRFIEESEGTYCISVIDDAFKFILNNIANADQLNRDWGTEDYWAKLSGFVVSANNLDELLLKALNAIEYDHFDLLSKWKFMDEFKKRTLWIWNKIYQKDDYLTYAISGASNFSDIPNQIECAVFSMRKDHETEWLKQRVIALKCLYAEKLSAKFWASFAQVRDNRERLKLLTGITFKERVAIIKAASLLLKSGKSPAEISKLVKESYPAFSEYLTPSYRYELEEINKYFDSYRRYKVEDNFCEEIQQTLEDIYNSIWTLPSRGSIIEKYTNSPNTILLCIDGMGIEWISLLQKIIRENEGLMPRNVNIATAKIPTDTKYNWPIDVTSIDTEKNNHLDDISHDKTGSVSTEYPEVIAKQLEAFSLFAEKIVELIKKYKTVVITADHGLSRMAALAFHQLKGIEPPEGAEVENLGRYCKLENSNQAVNVKNTIRDGEFIAFKTHHHFISPGKANGELHGGVTPEEILVPVIVYENPHFDPPEKEPAYSQISYTLKSNRVKRSSSNTIELEILFDQPVSEVDVTTERFKGTATQLSSTSWLVVFPGLSFKEYQLQVVANGMLLQNNELFTVERQGLEVDDGGL